jgi:WD40 repeat protein
MEYFSVAFSDDGKWIAAGGRFGKDGENRINKVVVWEVETGKVMYEWTDSDMVGAIASLAFSPDMKTVAAGGPDDATIRVWEMGTGKVKHRLNAHGVWELAFARDGKTLVSVGSDRKVMIWDVATEKPRVTLEGHGEHARGEFVNAVAVAPGGRTVASGSWDGTIRFWPLAPLEQPKK